MMCALSNTHVSLASVHYVNSYVTIDSDMNPCIVL